MAREIIKKGDDIRGLRKTLNNAFAGLPTKIRAEGAATSTSGDQVTFSVVGEDIIYIKLDSKTGTSPIKYAWTAMVQDRDTGAWVASPRAGVTADDSYAVELNNASLTTGGSTRYPARVSPQSGKLTFRSGGGGGGASITSGETVLMILGPWTDYKDCPEAPPDPPMTFANPPCDDTRTTTPCVPAYAFAVYQRCGYVWNKVGDSRTSSFGVWATELNGGSTSAWGRFSIPRWGGDIDPVTGIPDPGSACMGVAFVDSGAAAVVCTCPTWFTAIDCLTVRVKWIDEPGSRPVDCPEACWDLMTDRWGTIEETTILWEDMGCVVQGDLGPFPVNILWTQYDWGADCFWGPDEVDPCNLCAGFGKLVFSINSGSAACGNAANAWMGWEFTAKSLFDLICNCETGPLRLSGTPEVVGSCGQLAEYVELDCCSEALILDGGADGDIPFDIVDGEGATDIYDGGSA